MSNIKQLVGNFNVEADVTPNQGMGSLGEWPKPGEHSCVVTGMTMSDEDFRMRVNDNQQEIPGWSLQFHYMLTEDPDHDTPLTWSGSIFRFPKDESQVTAENQQTRIRIAKERLAGHITALLGRPQTNLGADLEEIEGILHGANTVVAMVSCRARTKGDQTYREEYIQKVLSK